MDDKKLWQLYEKTKDKHMKEKLILKYVSIVRNVAGRLFSSYGNNVEYEDLISYGIFGLIDAIDKFDYNKNVKFETYAQIRIRGAIIDQLRNLDWVPRSIRQKHKNIEKAYSELENRLGRYATDREIAEYMGLSKKELDNVFNEIHTLSIVSLEEKISNNSNFSIISNYHEYDPDRNIEKEEIKAELIRSLENLSEKEQMVIKLYYYEELTYKEIAHVLSVSESRISQIHSKAINKLGTRLSTIM
ncbi:MAG: FliA/WhiG family RNA polymerase sigma factor [Anaeromicrobium sp.]|uniref:FliA/WhiG family RNA polymerase sigma factor n=1 Tax=Anaeromicrobium sp. TaxID=1929132 RepID=UPI0025E933A1|nr:FliA/WhiG family RNA polymerase sigma factor [Anaeromicrobium sp.]MCT4595608.1 FliA/WhiG family RNA polymerase sigma factor [Anaeromicrobium sp.]